MDAWNRCEPQRALAREAEDPTLLLATFSHAVVQGVGGLPHLGRGVRRPKYEDNTHLRFVKADEKNAKTSSWNKRVAALDRERKAMDLLISFNASTGNTKEQVAAVAARARAHVKERDALLAEQVAARMLHINYAPHDAKLQKSLASLSNTAEVPWEPCLLDGVGCPVSSRGTARLLLGEFVNLHKIAPGQPYADFMKSRAEMLAFKCADPQRKAEPVTATQVRLAINQIREDQAADDVGVKRVMLKQLPGELIDCLVEAINLASALARSPTRRRRPSSPPSRVRQSYRTTPPLTALSPSWLSRSV